MVGWTISKNALKNLFEELRTKYRVVGPVRRGGATYTYSFPTFDVVENWEDMELDYEFSMLPLKKIFFPDSQPIYSWEKKGETIDENLGIWRGVNEFVYKASNQALESFSAYSMIADPMTSCGCLK